MSIFVFLYPIIFPARNRLLKLKATIFFIETLCGDYYTIRESQRKKRAQKVEEREAAVVVNHYVCEHFTLSKIKKVYQMQNMQHGDDSAPQRKHVMLHATLG